MIEKFSANGPDKPFRDPILPWALAAGARWLHEHRPDRRLQPGREECRQEGYEEAEHRAGEHPGPWMNRQWFQRGRSLGEGQPNFQASGTTMTFGFFRNASTGYGGAGYTTAADTDNWTVTVRTEGAGARSPTWTNCNDTNSAGVCFVNLADNRTVNLSFE